MWNRFLGEGFALILLFLFYFNDAIDLEGLQINFLRN